MNCDDILYTLQKVTGDARGMDADDVLLCYFYSLSSDQHSEFWNDFDAALASLWKGIINEESDVALEKAASFVARLDVQEKSLHGNAAQFLLQDTSITPSEKQQAHWHRIASALRILTHLKEGDGNFWRKQLNFWINNGLLEQEEDCYAAALDALIQAVRGVVYFGGGLTREDFYCLLSAAAESKQLPDIEIYSSLVEATPQRTDACSAHSEAFADQIRLTLHDIVRSSQITGKTRTKNNAVLEEVVAAWLREEFNRPYLSVPRGFPKPWPEEKTTRTSSAQLDTSVQAA